MTNEKRIYKLCECVTDLIDELSFHIRDYNLNKHLESVKDEIILIMHDIYDK